MADSTLQDQMTDLNRKLDMVLEFVAEQKQKREEIDDLMQDLNVVAKDVFRQTVILLDKSQVELDQCGLSCLMIKVLQNLQTFGEMIDMMESARDFMKDVSPILHQIGLDAVHKMNELEQKGYFEYLKEIGLMVDSWVSTFRPEDLRRIRENIPQLAGMIRNLTQPEFISSLGKLSKTMVEIKPDPSLDNRSWWKLMNEMRSREVRQSLSYSLRLVKALNQ